METPDRTTFDNQFIELESVDSTNNYAMARIHEGLAKNGFICLAHFQTNGRGQRGKTWTSEAGRNLMMSLVIEPAGLILSRQFLFSAAVTLGLLDFVRSTIDGNWSVKWPNDLYWNDRKAGGVLIEAVIGGLNEWQWAVVGMGVAMRRTFALAVAPICLVVALSACGSGKDKTPSTTVPASTLASLQADPPTAGDS